jgi:hypothetical protein
VLHLYPPPTDRVLVKYSIGGLALVYPPSDSHNRMSKLIIIDDTNTNIQYSGPWFITSQNSQLNIGNLGPPFQNTLHGVNNNANFSYSFSGMSMLFVCFIPPSLLVFGRFSGSQVIVLGTRITTNASDSQLGDPSWECFIDNISIGRYVFSGGTNDLNSWVLCKSDLLDGPHVLSIKITVLQQQTFWLDQIQYLPSSNVPLDNATLRVDSSDAAVQYSSGWGELNGIVNSTQTAGSTITYEFVGP